MVVKNVPVDSLIGQSEPWMSAPDRNCVGVAPSVFFPGRGDKKGVEKAIAICRGCPYMAACRDFAIRHNEPGVWGGTSRLERKRMAVRVVRPIPDGAHGTHEGYRMHLYRRDEPCPRCREAYALYRQVQREAGRELRVVS